MYSEMDRDNLTRIEMFCQFLYLLGGENKLATQASVHIQELLEERSGIIAEYGRVESERMKLFRELKELREHLEGH